MIFNEMYLKLTPFHKVDPVIYGIRRLALYLLYIGKNRRGILRDHDISRSLHCGERM